jgi:hypothetical protein
LIRHNAPLTGCRYLNERTINVIAARKCGFIRLYRTR